MKKIIYNALIVISICVIFLSVTINVYANNGANWYIKRNGQNTPTFPDDAVELSEYNCYYVDKRLAGTDEERVLYLTFDAGYENGNIEKILDAMKSENVHAAFFILDNIITKNTNLVNRMYNEGHLICNHTKDHKSLCNASYSQIENSLTSLEKIYLEYTGREMDKFFRFPEGRYSKSAVSIVNDLGYKTIFWSFAYDDWDNSRQPNRQTAIKKIIDNTHNGAVMLFHPTSSTNAEIFPELIRTWKSMGYSFGSLYDLTSE